MALLRNNVATGQVKMPNPSDSDSIDFRMSFTLTADVALNDIIELGNLPAGCIPVDLIFDYDDLDSGSTGTASFGVLNAGKTDLDVSAASGGSAWLAATSIQAVGAVRADAVGLRAMSRVVPDQNNDRPIGLKIVTETVAAAGQVVGVTLRYRPA